MMKHTNAVLEHVIGSAASAPRAALNDRGLLHHFATSGDQEAFAALFRRHSGMVLGVCRRTLTSMQDAEDACQATFLLLSRKAGSGRWQPSVANWLYLTARRVAHNARRSAERLARRERRAAVPEAQQPMDRITGREFLDVLDAELENLPAAYREPLVLCYLEGLTREEAAARLGLPPATIKTRLERGRKRLGDALTKRGCVAGAGLLALAATSPAGNSPLSLASAVLTGAAGRPSAAVAKLADGVRVKGIFNRSVAALLLLTGTASLGFGLLSRDPQTTPPQVAAQAAAPDQASEKKAGPIDPAKPNVAPPGSRLVSGRVLTPDGKPAAGARMFVPVLKTARPVSIEDVEARSVGTTEADGRFAITVPPPINMDIPRLYAIAYAPGYGVDWLELDPAKDSGPLRDQTLRLTKDVPIVGRVMNTEGRPVAGASISVANIIVPVDENVDTHLAYLQKGTPDGKARMTKSMPGPLTQIVEPTVTDKDGRFIIRGTGAERFVRLLISGGGIAQSTIFVVTRPGLDTKPINERTASNQNNGQMRPSRYPVWYAPEFTFVAESAKEISGTITDADTGAPIPGCRVLSPTGQGNASMAMSDARGHYRLEALAKNTKGYVVSVDPPTGTTYLAQVVQASDSDGYAPVHYDFRVVKASVVTGRLVDKQTGKGVRASIRIVPLPSNKFFETRPEYRLYVRDRTLKPTDAEGRFRLATIPGQALILAQVDSREKLHGDSFCRYRRAVPDASHPELYRRDDNDSWTVVTAGKSFEFLNTENTVQVIDVKETGETAVSLFVDPGVTAKIEVRDANGQPLAGAWIAGLADYATITYRVTESTATVYALDPHQPRTLAFYHPERKVGGTVTIRGDEKEPVVARLGPLGRVSGRLLDVDGKPLAEIEVSYAANDRITADLYRIIRPNGGSVQADKNGRFAIEDVMPAMPFYLFFRKDKQHYVGKPKVGINKLKPGETLELGDRILEPYR